MLKGDSIQLIGRVGFEANQLNGCYITVRLNNHIFIRRFQIKQRELTRRVGGRGNVLVGECYLGAHNGLLCGLVDYSSFE